MHNRLGRVCALVIASLAILPLGRAPAVAQSVYDAGSGYARRTPAGSVLTDQNGNALQSTFAATIASGASVSGTIDLGSTRLFAIQMPSGWTAAGLTFLAATVAADAPNCNGATFSSIYDDTGTEVAATVAASQYIVMSVPGKWLGVRCLQIRSGTSGTPVNQAASRTLSIVGVP